MSKSTFTLLTVALLISLAACATHIPFEVLEFKSNQFSSSKTVYIESGPEIVPLSSRLGNRLTRAGFRLADSRNDAAYILTFQYAAEFHVYPWVITSFSVTVTEAESADVVYKIKSAKAGREAVDSLLGRIVDDITSKFLTSPMRGHVAIIDGGVKKE